MAEHDAYFTTTFSGNGAKLGAQVEGADDCHLEFQATRPHPSLTETQYFGFNVPEHDIHGFMYLWHHPNLNVATAGPMVMQGHKAHQLECEIFDYRAFMSDAPLRDNFRSYQLESGYGVEQSADQNSFRTFYSDPMRDSHVNVTHTGISERLFWPGSQHFEQVMKCEGEVVIRGKTYKVDGYNVRDRSWGEVRQEDPFPNAPSAWTTGVFGEAFAFNVTGADSLDLDPIWKDRFAGNDNASSFKFGWVVVDGQARAVSGIRKITRYDRARLIPATVDLEITDETGAVHRMQGRVIASTPFSAWFNAHAAICLIRWEYEGRVGYGDVQEVQWTDFFQNYAVR